MCSRSVNIPTDCVGFFESEFINFLCDFFEYSIVAIFKREISYFFAKVNFLFKSSLFYSILWEFWILKKYGATEFVCIRDFVLVC